MIVFERQTPTHEQVIGARADALEERRRSSLCLRVLFVQRPARRAQTR